MSFSMKIYVRPSLYLFLKIMVISSARMPDFSKNLTLFISFHIHSLIKFSNLTTYLERIYEFY